MSWCLVIPAVLVTLLAIVALVAGARALLGPLVVAPGALAQNR